MDQIFSAKPKPFRINRKSRLASKLKSSIAAKLSEFLGDYSDDVFLEYVTVLICTGKDQYQAREDLYAFLGERSEEFVSWLWNYLDEAPGISPPNSDTDFRSHINKLLRKGDRVQHSACDPASHNDMKLAKGSQYHPSVAVPSTEVNTRIVLSQGRANEISRRYIATGDADGERDQRTQSKSQNTQIVKRKCSGLPRAYVCLTEREALRENTEFFISGHQMSTQIYASTKSGINLSQRSIDAGSILTKKSRGSVWDRLGKPCEDISGGLKSVDFGVGHNKQYEKIRNQLALIPPTSNSEDPAFDKKKSYSYRGEMKKMEYVNTAVSELHFSSNIGRKRLFGQISTCLDTGSAFVDHSSMDPGCKDTSQIKKSNVATNDLKTIQNQVHFAATREALALYFAKCGVVANVMILTDTLTSKPKGSAYVTFASWEC